ncbi:hypothetical protein DPEC_G00361570 [Dallia pectoralis]|nr:hypothetical protein DPEC_G00361570 [Dallia pectoralis]
MQTKLVHVLNTRATQCQNWYACLDPALAPDMPGQQHEITCVSLIVILNSHIPQDLPGHHRKKLIVLYNKCKVSNDPVDHERARAVGIDQCARIIFHPVLGLGGLFMTRALTEDMVPFFQFENVRYLAMYKEMLKSLGPWC